MEDQGRRPEQIKDSHTIIGVCIFAFLWLVGIYLIIL